MLTFRPRFIYKAFLSTKLCCSVMELHLTLNLLYGIYLQANKKIPEFLKIFFVVK